MYRSRSSYSDALKWIKSARPRRINRWRFAERAFGASLMGSVPLLCVLALLSPSAFGARGSNTLRTGWPLYVLLAILGVSVALVAARSRRIRWALARLKEPFLRSFEGDARFDGARDALAQCPAPLRTRFALGWVWGPAGLAAIGVIGAFSCAYFLIDAIMARFEVDLDGAPLYAAGNAALSLLMFHLGAGRLLSWRLAVSVHRSVQGGY